jgi:hypothetical protein
MFQGPVFVSLPKLHVKLLGQKHDSLFAGIIQIKFSRIISERRSCMSEELHTSLTRTGLEVGSSSATDMQENRTPAHASLHFRMNTCLTMLWIAPPLEQYICVLVVCHTEGMYPDIVIYISQSNAEH